MNALRIKIKEIRISKEITQEDLASMLGISQAEMSRKENGITSIDIDQLVKIATALGVTITDLLSESDQQPMPRTG